MRTSKLIRIICATYCLLVLSTAVTASLHFHIAEQEAVYSEHDHSSECALCVQGVNQFRTLAFNSTSLPLDLAKPVGLFSTLGFQIVSSLPLSLTARAPPI